MGLLTWIKDRLLNGQSINIEITPEEFFSMATEAYVRNLAFESAVNFIGNTISKCEFKTFFQGKEKKGAEYYLWNIEPSKNQNSSEFIHKLVSKLYGDNEVLVIEADGQLIVADSFYKKEYALFDSQFTQVTAGEFKFNKTFLMSDVLYFKLNNNNIRTLINGMYESYGKLISYGQKSWLKSRGSRGILSINAIAQGKKDFAETLEKLMGERFKNFFEAENAVLPLFDGYKYDDIGSKTYGNESTRDIRAMIDDIYDFTARAFNIPPALLRGDLANIGKEVIDNYLTFCIDPLTDMLSEEINRKRNGYAGFVQGTFLKIDTKNIKHVDLLGVATAIDKLIGSGCFCINDIRKAVGDEPINEDWANQHFITKNYETVEQALQVLGSGDAVDRA